MSTSRARNVLSSVYSGGDQGFLWAGRLVRMEVMYFSSGLLFAIGTRNREDEFMGLLSRMAPIGPIHLLWFWHDIGRVKANEKA